MSYLEVPKILRLLKTLERSVQIGEDLDPFKVPPELQTSAKRSVTKRSGKGSKRAKASELDPSEDGNSVVDPEPDDQQDASVNLEGLLKCLTTAKESIMAAECCISILSSDRLPKQVRTHALSMGGNLTIFQRFIRKNLSRPALVSSRTSSAR
jgi:cohesin loading factor subunit SCC2